LNGKSIKTNNGKISDEKIVINAGYPGGYHVPVTCWHYKHDNSNLSFAFGFYSNFTENDLMCLVGKEENIRARGIGASVQFNSDKSVKLSATNSDFDFYHGGNITVRYAVKREVVANLINELVPDIAKKFLIHGKESWPVFIGSTNNMTEFIDNLFLYVYAIEQVKRKLRGKKLLPPLDVTNTEKMKEKNKSGKTGKGQGFSSDSMYNSTIENYAMQKAIKFYENMGYRVKDVSKNESYDLHCEKYGKELFVEVKGTSGQANSIIMTSNEVKVALNNYHKYDLFIVTNIIYHESNDKSVKSYCSGGKIVRYKQWKPDEDKLIPLSYKVIIG